MLKQPARLWITALILGWFFDYLFFAHSMGVAFAIYAVLTLTGGLFVLWLEGLRPSKNSLLLMPIILFFAIFTFLRREPLSYLLAHAFSLLLMAVLAVTYQGGQWLRYSLADYVARAFELTGSLLALPFKSLAGLRLQSGGPEGQPKSSSQFWPVLRGLLLAVPVVLFFAALLSSADLVFAKRLSDLAALFRLERLPEYIFRLAFILGMAYALAGVYLHAAGRSLDEKLIGLEKPVVPPFLGFTEAGIILGSVVLLFAAFVLIQFQYFFGGQANINLDGFTYAEYARKGFGELVITAFFALLLFLGLTSITRRETPFRQRVFAGLGLALLAMLAVMLVSAYRRLVLYEDAYGFTRLRTYTHVFMIWVAVLLAVVVLLDLLQRQRAFALAALLASLGFAVSLNLLNVDGFIFSRNLTRFEAGESLDIAYLASLSPDAIPGMVSAYEKSAPAAPAHDRLGALLACIQNQTILNRDAQSWQSYNNSDYQARQALQRVAQDLKTYQLDRTSYPFTVTTPLKAKYDCTGIQAD